MNKIKITSTSNITLENSDNLKNIDFSYGYSYVHTNLQELTTVDTQNSWGAKILSALDKFAQLITKTSKENKDILHQIIEETKFIAHHQNETVQGLHIQINTGSKITNLVSKFSSNQKKELMTLGLKSEVAEIHPEEKKMFLGVDYFKNGQEFYSTLITKISPKDAISFIFYHEYSHMAEYVNKEKYPTKLTNTSYDNLLSNLKMLSHPMILLSLEKITEKNSVFKFPTLMLVDTLKQLHAEIYADVGSLLLNRNKEIINNHNPKNNSNSNNLNDEDFTQKINYISKVRIEEKDRKHKFIETSSAGEINAMFSATHFTTSGLEHLAYLVSSNELPKRILTQQEIHDLSMKCVDVGIAKTILTFTQADNTIVAQLNTLVSMEINKDLLSISLDNTINKNDLIKIKNDKNYYEEMITALNSFIPTYWTDNFKDKMNRLEEVKGLSDKMVKGFMIFNAGLDEDKFETKLSDRINFNRRVFVSRDNHNNNQSTNHLESISQIKETITNIRQSQNTDKLGKDNKLK